MEGEDQEYPDAQNQGETEESSIHSAFLTFVKEAQNILELCAQISVSATAEASLCTILDKYQEQNQLLDPHLEQITEILFKYIKADTCDSSLSAAADARTRSCKVLYCLCKVRGFKTVLKFFPHEVSDLEPCFDLLNRVPASDLELWHTRYVLLLWLSTLVMVPFALNIIDSQVDETSAGLIERIIAYCKFCLGEPGKTRDAASFLLAKMLTRPDLESSYLVEFLQWSREKLGENPNQFLSAGLLSTLSSIFKHGQRNCMLDKVPIVFDIILDASPNGSGNQKSMTSLARKLVCKLAQRIGLTYVPVRIAPWRYQRGCRSLLDNLKKQPVAAQSEHIPKEKSSLDQTKQLATQNEEDDSYVPMEMDCIVDLLLRSLSDRDTVVRWSAAKGVGRLTGRLPGHLADEVVAAVLSSFLNEEIEQDCAWHGGCLALAELARRGLLLPSRLAEAVPLVVRSLRYDVRKGSASVGSHVRDSACYVCWAFARAYAPDVIQPHMESLARGLVVASVYDREINCRRAASAAFQECVGRLGNFPHGIDILTKADYFTLGNRSNSFLEISIFIAQYDEYQFSLVDFLVKSQIRHWDRNVRSVSAETLRHLARLNPTHFVTNVISELIEGTLSPDLPTRHGCTLAVAETFLGLRDAKFVLSDSLNAQLIDVVPQIEKARLYRGRGGEIMRGASCRMIECLALGSMTLTSKSVTKLMESVDENLKHPTEDIQAAAVSALRAFSEKYFAIMTDDWKSKVIKKYSTAVASDPNPAARRGFALALGAIDRTTASARLDSIIEVLVLAATRIEEKAEDRDAESRRNAVRGLRDLFQTVGKKSESGVLPDEFSRERFERIFDGLMMALDDYCTDHRGDVGSWVREAAMRALVDLYRTSGVPENQQASNESGPNLWDRDHELKLVHGLIKQLGEKIDRVRECAGSVLSSLLRDGYFSLLHCEGGGLRNAILGPVGGVEGADVDWSAPTVTFPRLVMLLDEPAFMTPVLSGMVISVGGLTESLCRASWQSLYDYLRRRLESSDRSVGHIFLCLLDYFEVHQREDRITLPLLKTLHLMFTNGCLDEVANSDSKTVLRCAETTQSELRNAKDVQKLQTGASVLCSLLPFAASGSDARGPEAEAGQEIAVSLRDKCLRTLLSLLGHRFPLVRKHVAEQLYLALLMREDLCLPEQLEETACMLSEQDWFQEPQAAAPHRQRLRDMLGVAPLAEAPKGDADPAAAGSPAPGKGAGAGGVPAGGEAAAAARRGVGYQDLVKEMHY